MPSTSTSLFGARVVLYDDTGVSFSLTANTTISCSRQTIVLEGWMDDNQRQSEYY